MSKTYTVDDIYGILANLENGTESYDRKMRKVKLPIPKEYGGGWATGSTYEEAVSRIIERVKDQIKVNKDNPLFEECYDKWMTIKKGQEKSPSTIANYISISQRYILPFFEGKRIEEITPDDIQMFYNSIMHLAKSTSIQSKAILKGIFDRAERNGFLESNPMRFKYERSKKTGKKVVLQDEDLVSVISELDKLEGKDYLYACFLCFTALRRGEILGLRWGDIDFEKDEINVQNNVTFPNGQNDPVILQPKDGSYGVVHLQSSLKERIMGKRGAEEEYVIPYSASVSYEPITRSMFAKMWKRIGKEIDLKGATSHSFRASYVTMMNAHCEHVDPKVLQGALRHKTPDLALKVYTKENGSKTRIAEMEYDAYLCRNTKSAQN